MSTLDKYLHDYRKERVLSQNELVKLIEVHHSAIGKYKRDEVKPSIEVAAKIADELEVSLDFLIGKTEVEVDGKLLKRVIEVQQMEQVDKDHILYTLDALIKNVKLKSIA